eukprot:bmy_08030T0
MSCLRSQQFSSGRKWSEGVLPYQRTKRPCGLQRTENLKGTCVRGSEDQMCILQDLQCEGICIRIEALRSAKVQVPSM